MGFALAVGALLILSLYAVQGQQVNCNATCPTGQTDFFYKPAYGPYNFEYIHTPGQPPVDAVQSAAITQVIIVVHGDENDANDYWCYMNWAVQKAGKSSSTYIWAPHYIVTGQPRANNTMYWTTSTWESGGLTIPAANPRISSFTILDDVLTTMTNKTLWPGLKTILFTGHSGGGQTAHRYAISTQVDPIVAAAGITLKYIAENCGSYTYLDGNRATLPSIPASTCTACNSTTIPTTNWTFSPVPLATQAACPAWNTWKIGLVNPLNYTAYRTVADIRSQYPGKNVAYVLGTADTCNNALGTCPCDDNSLDTGCDSELEGYCRYMRGIVYYRYLQWFYGTKVHSLYTVEGVGHDGCAMLTSDVSVELFFPDFVPTSTTTGATTTSATTTSATATGAASTGAASTGAASTGHGLTSTTRFSTTNSTTSDAPQNSIFGMTLACIAGTALFLL